MVENGGKTKWQKNGRKQNSYPKTKWPQKERNSSDGFYYNIQRVKSNRSSSIDENVNGDKIKKFSFFSWKRERRKQVGPLSNWRRVKHRGYRRQYQASETLSCLPMIWNNVLAGTVIVKIKTVPPLSDTSIIPVTCYLLQTHAAHPHMLSLS